MIPFMFQKGNKSAGCEDAPPVATLHYSIVCDGLGGSGNTKHDVFEAGNETPTKRTSAYLGSRIVSDCVENFYQSHTGAFISSGLARDSVESLVGEMKAAISDALAAGLEQYHIEPLRSRTLRTFPTTLASAVYCPCNGGLKILAVWAGDSRVYVLSPSRGLQLLSVDDADGAADSMNSSSAMNNCISAGNPFRLNYALHEMNEPGIVFCCTDGCFDYIASPLHLEWALLNTVLECMPACDGAQLGDILASSIRDSVYPDHLLGDDTTMAGICFQIGSGALMKSLYRPRMDRFGPTALQLNQHIKTLKSIQKEREAAQKTCRLYEGKITDAIQKAVCDALSTRYPVSLFGFLSNMPAYAAYRELEAAVISENADLCSREVSALQAQANSLQLECRAMLKADYLKWQRITAEPGAVPALFGVRSLRSIDYSNSCKVYLNPRVLEQSIETLIAVYNRREFSSITAASPPMEEDRSAFIQRQTNALEAVISMLRCPDDAFIDLWGQAYFSTSMFSRDREALDADRNFNGMCEYALQNPTAYPFCSDLSARKIGEYQDLLARQDAVQEKYAGERQRKMAALPGEYFRQNRDAILGALLAQPADVLHSLFISTAVPVDRLIAFIDARRRMTDLDGSLGNAQSAVDQLWSQYRTQYELFKQTTTKGVI